MQRLFMLGLVAACTLLVAGCGSSGTGSDPNPIGSTLAREALAYARCMRWHGVTHTVLGGGAAYVQIPDIYNPHSQSFLNIATACGIKPQGNPRH